MKSIYELDEFNEVEERDNLLIVDCLNLCFRYKHRGSVDFKDDLLRTIKSLGKSYYAKDIIVLSDKGSSTYRKGLLETYKGARKEKFAKQTDEEKENAAAFFESFNEALEHIREHYPVICQKGIEADDVATYLTENLKSQYEHVWLVSTDKDWDLLLDDNVSRFSYVTRKEYTINNFYEHHGCDTPEEYISIKVLQGDDGDSVPGFANVGAKRAFALIRQYGDAFGVYENIPLEGGQKFIQSINENPERIPLNYALMDLKSFHEDAIGDYIEELDKIMEEL